MSESELPPELNDDEVDQVDKLETAEENLVDSGDLETVQKLRDAYDRIRAELGKVIVGQEEVLEQILISIFARGHSLLVGVPGLAKTLIISTLARCLSLSFSRIQFTPDLMPSDITGTEVIQEDKGTGERNFRFLQGPIFANVILADEINRTPPKTQAALLEAMQEHSVTTGGTTYTLEEPFFVLATQNPVEQEGTYPLPEAQKDRFMFHVKVDYPDKAEEAEIIKRTTGAFSATIQPVISGAEIVQCQKIVRKVPVPEHVNQYVLDLVRRCRPDDAEALPFTRELISWGPGPRACQQLILGGKVRAILQGRFHVIPEDIAALAHPVLRHRIVPTFSAEAEGITVNHIIDKVLQAVPQMPAAAAL